jgi:preprotein translocase subunit SecF
MTVTDPAAPGAARAPLRLTRWRFAGFAAALALLALTAATVALRGLPIGLDFTGGVLVEAEGPVAWDVAALRAALAAQGVPEAVVQLAEDGRVALVRAQAEERRTVDAVRAALGPAAGLRRTEVVGPKVSGALFRDGAIASLGAVLAVAVYVWLRFEAKSGVAAFLTTLHDAPMMVGFHAVTRLSFDLTSIAALLAVAGCSINDTVVVFDRVRELLSQDRAAAPADVIDRTIADTLRRTLMTSGATLAATVALMRFGGPAPFGFAAAVTFGVVAGTLSSVFVAAPLLLLPGRLLDRGEDPTPFGADAP